MHLPHPITYALALTILLTTSLIVSASTNPQELEPLAPHDYHRNDPSDWCCVVNKGVKFCFKCPSATSDTAVVLVPRATATNTAPAPAPAPATMTRGVRVRVRVCVREMETQEENGETGAMCCWTTGFIVFGCHLCEDAPPRREEGEGKGDMKNQSDVDVWEVDGREQNGQVRCRKLSSVERGEISIDDAGELDEVVCEIDKVGGLVCDTTPQT